MKEKLNQSKRLSKLKEQGFQTSNNVLKITEVVWVKRFQTHSRISDSIILYTLDHQEINLITKLGYEQY